MAIAVIAGLVRGFSGFGSALIYMPLISVLYGPKVTAPTLLLIDTICSLPFTVHAAPQCNPREVAWVSLAGFVFLPIGVMALVYIDAILLRWFIVALVLLALVALISGWRYSNTWWVLCGASSSILSPQIVASVWVGYPNSLVPMQTQFHGHPVAGGTFPALIWKAFMTKALAYLNLPPESFPSPSSGYAGPVSVVNRGGVLQRDNGVCRGTVQLAFYGGTAPLPLADCKPNEVDIPNVVGETIAAAESRLEGQPLTPAVIYRPARPGERLDVVVKQLPARGTASAHDTVTLVLPRSLHGAIPQLVGLPLGSAQAKAARLHLDVHVVGASSGKVTHQSPRPRTAATPGQRLTVWVKHAAGG